MEAACHGNVLLVQKLAILSKKDEWPMRTISEEITFFEKHIGVFWRRMREFRTQIKI